MLEIFKIVKDRKLFPIVPVFNGQNRPSVSWKDDTYHIDNIEKLEAQGEYFSYKNKNGENKTGKITGAALITGEKSGIMVLDLDRNHGADEIDGIAEYKKIIDSLNLSEKDREKAFNTFTVKTPNGGLHLYFKYREGLKNSSNGDLAIDIRTDGGIIITPGSLRKMKDGTTKEYTVRKNEEIQEMPEQLFNKLLEYFGKVKPAVSETKEANTKEASKKGRKSDIDKIYTIQREPGRNQALYTYVCRMVNMVTNENELYCLAKMYNETYLLPQLEEAEVNRTVESALKYMTKPYLTKNRSIIIGALVQYIINDKPNYVKGNNLYIYNKELGIYDYIDTKGQYQIYYDVVDKEAPAFNIDNTKAEKFSKTIMQYSKRYVETEDEKRYICCKNGIIDSYKNELLPYDPQFKLDCKFNGNFNPNYEEWLEAYNKSKFKKFLKDILIDDDVLITLQDMWGLMICPNAHEIQQVFIYHGSGSNGKSALFDIQEALFWDKSKNICGIPYEAFEKDQFILSMAEGKRVNIVRDDKIANEVTGSFKSAVCAEEVTVNRKHKDHVRMKFNLTWFYGMNNLPNTSDKSWGFYRRNCIIPFTVTFGTKRDVEEGKADKIKIPGITKDIIKEELDIVFMWAYWGLRRVLKNNYDITPNKASEKAMEDYRYDTDSVYAFNKDMCVREKGSRIKTTELYEKYLNWCEKEYRVNVSRRKFIDQMKQLGNKVYPYHGNNHFRDLLYRRFEEAADDDMPF